MWLNFPFHRNHSEAAYKATMDYLKKTPRTNKIPVWSAISFTMVSEDNIAQWRSKATWFKIDDFVAVMADLIKDPNFNGLGKAPAIRAVSALGGKAALEKLASAVEASGNDKIRSSYAKELEKAK